MKSKGTKNARKRDARGRGKRPAYARARKPSPPRRPTKPSVVTHSWVFPLTLTQACSQECGYCDFPLKPLGVLPPISKVKDLAILGRNLGVRQLRIVSGEGIENHTRIVSNVRHYGFKDFMDYLSAIIGEFTRNSVVEPLFPELDMGLLSLAQMQRLRSKIFTLRLYLDSMDEKVQIGVAHGSSKNKWPRHRLNALVNAGRLGIPVTSGIMIGIGETMDSREKALRTIAQVSRRYQNIQNVILHPFTPIAGTPMSSAPAQTDEDLIETAALAHSILPTGVAVTIPIAGRVPRAMDFLRAGATDFGDFDLTGDESHDSSVMNDYVQLKTELGNADIKLRDRLSLFPSFSEKKWVSPLYSELLAPKPDPKA